MKGGAWFPIATMMAASPSTVEAAGKIAFGKMCFVRYDVAGKASRHRPDAASIECIKQHRVRHEACYSSGIELLTQLVFANEGWRDSLRLQQ